MSTEVFRSCTLPWPGRHGTIRNNQEAISSQISGLHQSHYFSLSSLLDGFREHSNMTWIVHAQKCNWRTNPTNMILTGKTRSKRPIDAKLLKYWADMTWKMLDGIKITRGVSECCPLLHCCWCLAVVCHGQCVIRVSGLKTNYILNGLQISCVQSAGWFT